MQERIAIIGAGAAGCFAAANIPYSKDRGVTVYEKTGKVLQKVKVSGGGRCNVTHQLFEIPELIGRYPRGKQLLKKTLYRFGPEHTIDWFARRGVTLKAEADGRMFPVTDNSQTIIDCLWQEMMKQQVEVRYHRSVAEIKRCEGAFRILFSDGSEEAADRVLIACGGFPKDEQYAWIRALGHSINPPVPSLFTFNIPGNPITELMGVSVPEASVKIGGTKLREQGPVLVTHWGLSGPAILRTSAWGARQLNELGYEFSAQLNWLTDMKDEELKEIFNGMRAAEGRQTVFQKNPFELPRRLWHHLLQASGVKEDTRWGELTASMQNKLTEHLLRQSFAVKGKTTFKEEFVTSGGITLSEIDPATMESRIVPGLYFAGEILDVDGITGGFNFQHAWASGWVAAQQLG